MGFLDKVKDAAGKAADQAKHATAVGKEKLEDFGSRRRSTSCARRSAQLVVAQKRNEAPEDASAQIDAKVAEIGELEKQMEANNVGDGTEGGRRSRVLNLREGRLPSRSRQRACRNRALPPSPHRARRRPTATCPAEHARARGGRCRQRTW